MSGTSSQQNAGPKATAWDVLKAFWQGLRPYRYTYLLVILTIAAANALGVFIPIYYKRFFDVLDQSTNTTTAAPTLIKIILIVLFLNGILWVLYRIGTIAQGIAQAKTMARLKQNAFDYMIQHSYSFYSNNFTGSLTQKINRYARAFDNLADRMVWSITPLIVTVGGILIVLWRVKPLFSIIIFIWMVALIIFNYIFSRWKVKYDIRTAAVDSRTTGILSDNITNHNSVQLFGGFKHEIKNYKTVTTEQAKATMFSWNLAAVIDSVQTAVTILVEFLLFYISIRYWQQGIFTIGVFVLIQAYLIGLGDRLWGLSRIVRNLYEAFADAKEMVDIMLTPHDIKDLPGAKEMVVTKGEIEFKNLQFNYNATRTVLNNISTVIKAGEKVALIGPSGAGKSTFVRLILRLYDPTAGLISIDGQNIQQVTQESLRHHVSLVPQDPVLFHRSLKENIRYGKRDAADEEVLRAAKLAHCDEFIKDLPLAYDTLVGERGIKLSGGERQRIAIARAILKNAPILILDEATSSLDSESEHFIQDALDVLMKNKTVIVIAHRLSTIRKMDRIIVVDEGKISEEGTHDSLLQSKTSLYKKLWELQAGGFITDSDASEGNGAEE